MHSNAMSSGAQAEGYGRAGASRRAEAEINGQPDGIPEATVARLPVYLRALYGLAERGISTVAICRSCSGIPSRTCSPPICATFSSSLAAVNRVSM